MQLKQFSWFKTEKKRLEDQPPKICPKRNKKLLTCLVRCHLLPDYKDLRQVQVSSLIETFTFCVKERHIPC